ncbi:CPCC family cysteine-rich protein [Rubinisphaera margarita]|uniref:CPCC family cysteine-rich protein n=1 Tax=Rubinisphaera margarita TaxID=2909586 RepID=UPI0036F395B0
MKQTCPICGYKTLDARCGWDICPVCFWEDDVLIIDTDKSSPANGGLKVSEAQANYIVFRCCSRKHVTDVREPRPDEERDPVWQPLSEAFSLAESLRSDGNSRH